MPRQTRCFASPRQHLHGNGLRRLKPCSGSSERNQLAGRATPTEWLVLSALADSGELSLSTSDESRRRVNNLAFQPPEIVRRTPSSIWFARQLGGDLLLLVRLRNGKAQKVRRPDTASANVAPPERLPASRTQWSQKGRLHIKAPVKDRHHRTRARSCRSQCYTLFHLPLRNSQSHRSQHSHNSPRAMLMAALSKGNGAKE
jgi:hypothetical protein